MSRTTLVAEAPSYRVSVAHSDAGSVVLLDADMLDIEEAEALAADLRRASEFAN